MKKILTAILITSVFSLPSNAFEVDLTRSEALERAGVFTVGQLAVSQRGFVSPFALCYENRQLYARDWNLLSDPWDTYIELVRLPNGAFAASFQRNRAGPISFSVFTPCASSTGGHWERWPIQSLNSFTKYSEWLDYMKFTYEFKQ